MKHQNQQPGLGLARLALKARSPPTVAASRHFLYPSTTHFSTYQWPQPSINTRCGHPQGYIYAPFVQGVGPGRLCVYGICFLSTDYSRSRQLHNDMPITVEAIAWLPFFASQLGGMLRRYIPGTAGSGAKGRGISGFKCYNGAAGFVL